MQCRGRRERTKKSAFASPTASPPLLHLRRCRCFLHHSTRPGALLSSPRAPCPARARGTRRRRQRLLRQRSATSRGRSTLLSPHPLSLSLSLSFSCTAHEECRRLSLSLASQRKRETERGNRGRERKGPFLPTALLVQRTNGSERKRESEVGRHDSLGTCLSRQRKRAPRLSPSRVLVPLLCSPLARRQWQQGGERSAPLSTRCLRAQRAGEGAESESREKQEQALPSKRPSLFPLSLTTKEGEKTVAMAPTWVVGATVNLVRRVETGMFHRRDRADGAERRLDEAASTRKMIGESQRC